MGTKSAFILLVEVLQAWAKNAHRLMIFSLAILIPLFYMFLRLSNKAGSP